MGWLRWRTEFIERKERFVSIFIRFCAGPFNIMAWRGNLFHCTVCCCCSSAIIHNNNKVFSVSPPAPRARQQQPNSQPRGKFNIGHYRTASLSLARSLARWHIKTSARRTAADGYRFYQTTVKHGRRHRGFELLPGVIWILQPLAIIAIEGERFKNVYRRRCRHRRVLSALAELFIVINSLITLCVMRNAAGENSSLFFWCCWKIHHSTPSHGARRPFTQRSSGWLCAGAHPSACSFFCCWRCIVKCHCPLWCAYFFIDDKGMNNYNIFLLFIWQKTWFNLNLQFV